MDKIRSKAQILKRLQKERNALENTISSLNQDDMLQVPVVGVWTIKDVLAHLADWEAHMLVWVEAARRGDPVEHPDPGLTWRQLKLFNQRIYEAHRDQTLQEVFEYFHAVHAHFMAMVEGMPDEELLTDGIYAFLGKGSICGWLGQYAAHDRWGNTHILKWLKTQQKAEERG